MQNTQSQSFWLLEAQDAADHLNKLIEPDQVITVDSVDVVVVGAGITGCSAAYWLKKLNPTLSVTVIDRRGICEGATGRNGGHIWPALVDDWDTCVRTYGLESTIAIWDFTKRTADAVKEFVDEYGNDCELRFHGSVDLAKTEHEWAQFQKMFHAMSDAGVQQDLELWDASTCAQKTLSTKFFGGIYNKRAGLLWPAKLVFQIATAAHRLGAKFITHTAVKSVESKADSLNVVTDRGTLFAKKVIYATNAWTNQLVPFAQQKIVPVRGQVIITEPMPDMYWDFGFNYNEGYEYFMQRPDRSIVLGGCRWKSKTMELECDDDSTLNPDISQGLASFLPDHFPSIFTESVPTIKYEWTGIMGFSQDRLPLVGPVPNQSNEFLCAGYTGGGMPMAFLCAKAVAQMIAGKQPEPFVASFLLQRFTA